MKAVGVVLQVLGPMASACGGFGYKTDTTVVRLGPFELVAKEQSRRP